jgi:hypothetical protein
VEILKSPSWKFTKDQWEPEVWGKVLRKVGEEGMIYCASDIPEPVFSMLPGVSGYDFLTPAGKKKSRAKKVQEMVQNAVLFLPICNKNASPRWPSSAKVPTPGGKSGRGRGNENRGMS